MKLTFIITPLMVVLVLGSYFYSLWAAEVKRRDELPQDGAASLTRDLLKYHEQTGTFPELFFAPARLKIQTVKPEKIRK